MSDRNRRSYAAIARCAAAAAMLCCIGAMFPRTARAAANPPNIMIFLDNSGSMGLSIQVLPAYAPGTIYAQGVGVGTYTATTVYQQDPTNSSNYLVYFTAVSSVPSSSAQTGLNTYGFWFGAINNIQIKLFMGNYLNYEFCPTGSNPSGCSANDQLVSQTKMAVAQRIINEVLGAIQNTRFGVMDFRYSASPYDSTYSEGGQVVGAIGTSTATLVGAVNAIAPNGNTPTAPAIKDVGLYFAGSFGYPTPSASACQPNSVILISDGQYNWPCSPDPSDSTYSPSCAGGSGSPNTTLIDPAVVAASLHANQSLVVNTIGLNATNDPLSPYGTASLQQIAANAGGQSFSANGTAQFVPQLEQALFSLPLSIAVTAPGSGSILTGTQSLSAYVQIPAGCVSAVQFYLSGSPILAQLTAAPFAESWDTTQSLNGNYVVTAGLIDTSGNTTISNPVAVGINNVITLPQVVSPVVGVGFTTATVSWQTNVLTDAQVVYGTSTSYGQQTLLQDANPRTTSHVVTLSGLTPGIQYFYQIVSHDSAGRAAFSAGTFNTQTVTAGGTLNHFGISFLGSSGATQTGPGTRNGAYPYVLTVGNCFAMTIEALDNSGVHSNYTGPVTLSQYLIDSGGNDLSLAPGIALYNNFQLGVATMGFSMSNGFLFLGSASDVTHQLCFYRATREPGDAKQPGAQGDLHLRVIETNVSSVTGISAGYVSWRGLPSTLLLAVPNQTLAPATPSGLSGSPISQNQGGPFTVTAYETDQYWNPILSSRDTLAFSSSLSTQTAFNPFSGTASAGAVTSSATINACNAAVTLTARDVTSPAIFPSLSSVQIGACGAGAFYSLSIPTQVVAGAPFVATVTANNVNVPLGSGGALFSGNLFAALPNSTTTQFAYTGVSLGAPVFSFTIPEATSGTYAYLIPNESYNKAGTVWLDLVAQNPDSLAGAAVLAGPLVVVPGPPAIMTLTPNPSTLGPYSSSQLTVTITDALGNGISGRAVTVTLVQGTGKLGVNANLLTETLTTDASGVAVTTYTSAGTSENDLITAVAPALNLPQITAQVQVSLLGNATMAAYPSPVKITERPLSIEYKLAQDSQVTLTVTDLFGREVWRADYDAGTAGGKQGFNVVKWDGRNGNGVKVAVGAYVLHMVATANGQKVSTVKYRFGVVK